MKPDTNAPIRVFVYGTLKHGFRNNYLLKNQVFLGPAESTFHGYQMYDNGSYPCLIDGSQVVKGEMYVVDDYTLENLDLLESNGTLYTRKKRMFNVKGISLEAWVYMYQKGCKGMSHVDGCEYKRQEEENA